MPIRLRLALLFAAASGLVALAGGLIFARQLLFSLQDSVDRGLRATSAPLAAGVTATNPPSAPGVPVELPGTTGIAQIVTSNGQVLAASEAAGRISLMHPEQLRKAQKGVYIIQVEAQLPGAPGSDVDRQIRLLARPTSVRGELVVVGGSVDTLEAATSRSRNQLLVLGAASVVLAGLGAYVLAAAALRPMERMRAQAAAITAADPSGRLAVPPTRDEVARLAQTLNDLLARVQAARDQERAFVADAGHELRTPLAILKGELELAARPDRDLEELRATVDVAAEATERLIVLSEGLLALALAQERPFLHTESIDLAAITAAAAAGCAARANATGVRIELDAPTQLPVVADPVRLRQALDNLLSNALRYAPGGSAISIRAASSEDGVLLSVADSGPGFPADFLGTAFERFRRGDTASADGGSGLGLSIVRAIAEAHGGRADAQNRVPIGALVTLWLPTGTSHPEHT